MAKIEKCDGCPGFDPKTLKCGTLVKYLGSVCLVTDVPLGETGHLVKFSGVSFSGMDFSAYEQIPSGEQFLVTQE